MNPRENEDAAFDKAADAVLRQIERAVSVFDPDEIEAELAQDVLTLTHQTGQKIVINRHRAARQMWMAALRKAWHFTPQSSAGSSDAETVFEVWKSSSGDELWQTLETVLSSLVRRPISLKRT
ncbi:MAG TPA: iron donor protein CyaY [Pseudomonadota bacterium]|nr:iron donor protein CyaY [Pseudomonadota bacterium]